MDLEVRGSERMGSETSESIAPSPHSPGPLPRRRLIGRLRIAPTLAMIFTGLVSTTAFVTGASVYCSSLEVAKITTAVRLQDASRLLASQLDADELASLRSPAQQNEQVFAKTHQIMARSLDEIQGVRYIYILRKMQNPGKNGRPRFAFVVDGLSLRDKDFQATGNEMATSDTTDALFRVWKTGNFEVDRNFVTDKWGTWLSGYLPLIRRDGSFEAVLGIDISAGDVARARQRVLLILTGGYLLSLLLILPAAAVLGRRISKPLRAINERLLAISRLDFDRKPGQMVKALWVKEIFEITESLGIVEKALRDFNRYVPSKLVRRLVDKQHDIELNGEARRLAIMFTDIIGFVDCTQNLPAAEILGCLNEYFSEINAVAEETEGVLDKYMGDSALLFWGAPDLVDSPARCCVEAALLCRGRLARLNDRWKRQGKTLIFQTSIGIDYGEVLVGNIGASERVNYTIVGDRVTLASRVERVNRTYGTRVLATRALIEALGTDVDRYVVVKVDRTRLRGFRDPIDVYEIRGHWDSAQEEEKRFSSVFNRAIAAYEQGDTAAAVDALAGVSATYRHLPYVHQLQERCRAWGEDRKPLAEA
ncbi:MAG: hypothetical protein ER33_16090 [Cyanobium sp. CACIAM 14]|nr:MAG: hypothetical protein ER33_16090 [Cyanobium sp. CACIAM 14]